MYSPADLPSSTRAAPAKKRRLSTENGISSRDAISGLPTFSDSSCASSSACSSITSASACSSSERSFGVFSDHVGHAAFAAATARSTSSAEQRGTVATTSPVAGAITSIVSPDALSANSPPISTWYEVAVALISCLLWTHTQDTGVAHQPLRERDRDDRHDDHREGDRIYDRQLLAEPDVAEDQQGQRVLRARREVRDDDLVEREREGEQAARDERRRQDRPDDEAESLQPVGAEVGGRLHQRRRRAPQPRERVVVDYHHAERRMTDHDRPHRDRDVTGDEEGVQRHAGDDAGQGDRQHEHERDGVAAEEREARDPERGHRADHQGDARRHERDAE